MANKIKSKIEQDQLYWTFQISGWSLFLISYTAFGIIIYEFDWRIVVSYLSLSVIGFVLSHFYRLYVKKKNWQNLSIGRLAVRIILAPLVLAIIWELLFIPVTLLVSLSDSENSIWGYFALTFNLTIIFFIWNLIYFFYKLFTSYKASEIEKWRLMASVKDAQLIALKSQINPHFIFNSLNNIRSLISENPEKSRDMITHLSSLLRYSIQFNNAEKVTLADEIDIVRYYLNLESIQFEDRLKFELNVDDKALHHKIPPMAIQMLVENAIKHGISKLPDGGEVSVDCRLIEDKLVVEVTNTGQIERDVTENSGIGLKNATDRLKLLFGKMADLTLENINREQVRARFTVPL